MKTFITILLISVVLSIAAAQAPLLSIGLETTIPDEYIVVLNEGLSVETRDSHVRQLTSVHPTTVVMHKYALGKLIGFAAVMDKGALARELEHEDVKYIEANQRVYAYADETVTQTGADWGLDRISQVSLPLDQEYKYFKSSGYDVDVYVVDTGISLSHQEFVGRVHFGANFISGETDDDCNGHGTHVAGTIAGTEYGVAKQATLWAVKVLSCEGSGSYAGVIAGIEWTVKNHQERKKASVANMSLGGGISATVDKAVTEAIVAGVTFVVAAGNNNLNACNYSPSRVPTAITVGATTKTDNRASFSNYGTCVSIFAPGYDIKSAWIGSDSATNVISGTSMASPHVAGAVAAYVGHLTEESSPIPEPADILVYLTKVATEGKVVNPGLNSPNKLLFSQFE